jgi:tRNA (guanine37-N1)-methyltransferase
MKITVLTLFNKIYEPFLNSSIIKKAIEKKLVEIEIINFRDFSKSKHKSVDDTPFGGGPGMVLSIEPIVEAIKFYKKEISKVYLLTPTGKVFNQKIAKDIAKTNEHIILISGHYEGFDARIKYYIDDEISIGDFILTGGEIPSLVIIDAVTRLIDNVIKSESLISESFENDLLDHSVYTKPLIFENHSVPEILLSGNHQKIKDFRNNERIELTKLKRNDLYLKFINKNKERENNDK